MNISFTAFAICANSGLNLPLRRDEKHVQSWSIAPLRLFYACGSTQTPILLSRVARGTVVRLYSGRAHALR